MLKDTLKELREARKFTKKQVASGVGISERAYIAYEYGERDVSTETLSKLADFYGVTTDYLLGREPAPEPVVDFGAVADEWDVLQQRMAKLPETEKAVLLNILHMLSESNKAQQTITVHTAARSEPGAESEPIHEEQLTPEEATKRIAELENYEDADDDM